MGYLILVGMHTGSADVGAKSTHVQRLSFLNAGIRGLEFQGDLDDANGNDTLAHEPYS